MGGRPSGAGAERGDACEAAKDFGFGTITGEGSGTFRYGTDGDDAGAVEILATEAHAITMNPLPLLTTHRVGSPRQCIPPTGSRTCGQDLPNGGGRG
jgi:hypothetical protein